ncbi:MAG: hypothetical protein ACR2N5_01860 [Solirubrobacterales bacterium]
MASPQQQPPRRTTQGAPPATGAPGAGAPPPAGPPSPAAAHAADLERALRRRTWVASLAIIVALAAAGVALYIALDNRENKADKIDEKDDKNDNNNNSAAEEGAAAGPASIQAAIAETRARILVA